MASLFSTFPRAGKIARSFLLLLLPWLCLGMASKPVITVRFYAEANKADTDRFARPLTFKNPPREGYVESVPTIHERHVKAVFPFPADDGTSGCAFLLDNSGRIN